MQFNVGDKVVYPNQGVGIIQDVCQKHIAGEHAEFYLLKLRGNNSTVMVPTGNADHVGLRLLSTAKQLEALFEILKRNSDQPEPDWKSRYKENVEKMKTGSIFEVAKVLKNLYCLNYQKTLSFREKKMYDRALQLVISEIATVQDDPTEEIGVVVQEFLLTSCEQNGPQTA